jgi:hypothetical protein
MTANPAQIYKLTLPEIVDVVSTVTGATLKSKIRDEHTVFSRWIYFKIARSLNFKSLNKIGREVNRDHATVLYGLDQVDIMLTDQKYNYFYNKALQELGMQPKEVNILEEIEIEDNEPNYDNLKELVNIVKDLEVDTLNELIENRIKPFIKLHRLDTNNNR